MNPHLASSLGIATAAIAAAMVMASGDARAEDITVDNTPFISKASRAEVRSEVFKRPRQDTSNEWSSQQSEPTYKSSLTRAQVRESFLQSRAEVSSMNAEDSGSSSYMKRRSASGANVLGGPEAP